jgi:hypothetical protein
MIIFQDWLPRTVRTRSLAGIISPLGQRFADHLGVSGPLPFFDEVEREPFIGLFASRWMVILDAPEALDRMALCFRTRRTAAETALLLAEGRKGLAI